MTPFDSDGNLCGEAEQCKLKTESEGWVKGTPRVCSEGAEKKDFTEYTFKYFPFTKPEGTGIFNSVCVKACPAEQY